MRISLATLEHWGMLKRATRSSMSCGYAMPTRRYFFKRRRSSQVISSKRNVTGGFEAFPAAESQHLPERQHIGAASGEPNLHIPAAFRRAIRTKLHSASV